VKPVGPCNPELPLGPVGPVDLTLSLSLIGPVDPCKPVLPLGPVKPVDPVKFGVQLLFLLSESDES